MSSCPLCKAEKITKRYWEDNVCWIADCSTHRDKKLIVLKRHAKLPTPEEAEHIKQLADKLFPNKQWRYGGKSIKNHFHIHEL